MIAGTTVVGRGLIVNVAASLALRMLLPVLLFFVWLGDAGSVEADALTAQQVKLVREVFSISGSVSDADLARFLRSEYKNRKTYFDAIRTPLALYQFGQAFPTSDSLSTQLKRTLLDDLADWVITLHLDLLPKGGPYGDIAYATVQSVRAILQAAGGIRDIMRAEENAVASYYTDQLISTCGARCTEKQSLASWNTTLSDLSGLPVVENMKKGNRDWQRVYSYSQLVYQGRRMFQYPEARKDMSDFLNGQLMTRVSKRPIATARLARDLTIYQQPSWDNEKGRRLAAEDCPGINPMRGEVPVVQKVRARETVDILDIFPPCGETFLGAYLYVRTTSSVTGYGQLEHTENTDIPQGRGFTNILILNDEGAFKIPRLENIRCEGDLDCTDQYYAEPYRRFIRQNPKSTYVAEAARKLVAIYQSTIEALERVKGERDATWLSGRVADLYAKQGDQGLNAEIAKYKQMMSEASALAGTGGSATTGK